ncbi:MAG: hypothetical protein LBS30_00170 [Planctomycetota bacterium]|nr:hypothetical protein [Planctomycetota bacterium]
MAEDPRRRVEMEAALKQIKTIQKRQARIRKRAWRLDVSVPRLCAQGFGAFCVGVLVGMGAFVLFWIAFS